jgi:hypothetical protein
MQVTGTSLYSAKLLQLVEFPTAKVLGSNAPEDEIKASLCRGRYALRR